MFKHPIFQPAQAEKYVDVCGSQRLTLGVSFNLSPTYSEQTLTEVGATLKHFKSICVQRKPQELFSAGMFQTFLSYSCYCKIKCAKTFITGMYLIAEITAKNKVSIQRRRQQQQYWFYRIAIFVQNNNIHLNIIEY